MRKRSTSKEEEKTESIDDGISVKKLVFHVLSLQVGYRSFLLIISAI